MSSAGPSPSGTELLGLSVMLAAAVLIPLVLGLVIDSRAHSGSLFFFIGLFVGVIAAVAVFWTRFKRYL